MTRFATLLPALRRQISRDLQRDDLGRERVLGGSIRLLDVGLFRVGGEEYADEDGGLGLATLRKEHVVARDGKLEFDYLAKSGIRRSQVIVDPGSVALVGELRRRRSGGSQLLAYKDGRRWRPVRSDDINEYLKHALGEEFSAKDFRTWNATVLAGVALAAGGRRGDSERARKRAIDRSVKAVAELLGNTPAVARRSYIDPRVFDRYLSGWTIAGALERIPKLDASDDRVRARIEKAILDLLADRRGSPALERD